MSELSLQPNQLDSPAMGERRARRGYGYQDKVCTQRILDALREDLRTNSQTLQCVRLADNYAGRVDDFVLVSKSTVEGNSIKWSENKKPVTWGNLLGKSRILLDLFDGWKRLRHSWPNRKIIVRFHTNRPPSQNRHATQLIRQFSVAEFIADHWLNCFDTPDNSPEHDVWKIIADQVNLTLPQLNQFTSHCELAFSQPEPPHLGSDSFDERQYREEFERLHHVIATFLTNNPSQSYISRDSLIAAIGLDSPRTTILQSFPNPKIPYERNNAAASHLKRLLNTTTSGYLAVVGPAGVGKSTLVQEILSHTECSYFIPYFAFLPSEFGTRDRADKLTFYRYVVQRLDRLHKSRRSLGIKTIPQAREAFRNHLMLANKRFIKNGHKTILLIDGLDQIIQEVGHQASLIDELPRPEELPDGFLVILSGQPQAFMPNSIGPSISGTVRENNRRVEVSGLSRSEVHTLISNLKKPTSVQERDDLYKSSQGNPLILTYILLHFDRSTDVSVTQAIASIGGYLGSIKQYYQQRLAGHLSSARTRRIIGLLCRVGPTLPVQWLMQWKEAEAIEDILQDVLAPFIHVDTGIVTFIHYSVIDFLIHATHSPLLGSHAVEEEKQFYSILAERSSGYSCLDPVGRAHIRYLAKADRSADVLNQLSSNWLRSAMIGFLPFEQIRPLLVAGYESAFALENCGEIFRLVLLSYELGMRSFRMDAAELSKILLHLGKSREALLQVQSEHGLLVEPNIALELSGTMWWHAHAHGHSHLKDIAHNLYCLAKPVLHVHTSEPVGTSNHHSELLAIKEWSKVATLFESPRGISQDIRNLVFSPSHNYGQSDLESLRLSLLMNALRTALDIGLDLAECQSLIGPIANSEFNEWKFSLSYLLFQSNPSEMDTTLLREQYEMCVRECKLDATDRSKLASLLYSRGDQKGALEIVKNLSYVPLASLHSHRSVRRAISHVIRLRRLKKIFDIPEDPVPFVTDPLREREVDAMAIKVAIALGSHLADIDIMDDQSQDNFRDMFHSLLDFHNHPMQFETSDSIERYALERLRDDIYQRVVELAKAMGRSGMNVLRDVVMSFVNGPVVNYFTPHQCRMFAMVFHNENVMSKEESVSLGLHSTSDSCHTDPTERLKACFQIALFLHRVGDEVRSELWQRRASEVSVGPGDEKDYHMEAVGRCLGRSVSQLGRCELQVLDRLSRAVEVSEAFGGPEAVQAVLRLVVRLHDTRACQLALEYIDRRVLTVPQVLEGMIAGGVDGGADAELLIAMYGHLYIVFATEDTSRVAKIVLKAFPPEQKRSAAKRLMSYVRTNISPSNCETVGRVLEDEIRRHGIAPISLTQECPSESDGSKASRTLYLHLDGSVATVSQVAEVLSVPSRPEEWNTNPDANAEFDWIAAIGLARVTDEKHFDRLISTFPQSDYHKSEVLVMRAKTLLRLGDRRSARRVFDCALNNIAERPWLSWHDGEQKLMVYRAFKDFDRDEGVKVSRRQLLADLRSGQLWPPVFLHKSDDIFALLEFDWPSEAVVASIDDYLGQVLGASPSVQSFEGLYGSENIGNVNEILCQFLTELVNCSDAVGMALAVRRVLASLNH